MPDLLQTSLKRGAADVGVTVMDSSEMFTFSDESNFLVIRNTTASPITPRITGSDASGALMVMGIGNLDLTGGYTDISIPVGESAAIRLDTIRTWLKGTLTITGCAGAEGWIATRSDAPAYGPYFIAGGRLVSTGKLTSDSKLWS